MPPWHPCTLGTLGTVSEKQHDTLTKGNMTMITNSVNIPAALAGDPDAWDQIVSIYQKPVYRTVFKRTGSHNDAMDLVQDVFVLAFRKLDQLHDPSKLGAWLNGIARRVRIKPSRLQPIDQFDPPAPEDEAETFTADEVRVFVNELPLMFREVVLAFYFDDRSIKEIARDLNLPQGTIKRRLHSARKRLLKSIREQE